MVRISALLKKDLNNIEVSPGAGQAQRGVVVVRRLSAEGINHLN